MSFLNLSRRVNWIIWLGALTLAPIISMIAWLWLGQKLWGMEFPGGGDGKFFVIFMGFLLGTAPYLFNLMAYGLAAPENHDQILAFYRQVGRSLIRLIVVGLVVQQLLPDWSGMTLGVITAILFWLALTDTCRTITVTSYVWRHAKSQEALRQYLLDHYLRR